MRALFILSFYLGLGMLPAFAGDGAAPHLRAGDAAGIDALCEALGRKVQENPDSAHELFRDVLESRESWSDDELLSLVNTMLDALPATAAVFRQYPSAFYDVMSNGNITIDESQDAVAHGMLRALATSPSIGADQGASLVQALGAQGQREALTTAKSQVLATSPVSTDFVADVSAAKEKVHSQQNVELFSIPSDISPAQ